MSAPSSKEAQLVTKVEVSTGVGTGSNIHIVEGVPKDLSNLVNEAIAANERFVTFFVPGDKALSVIAERVESIWQE